MTDKRAVKRSGLRWVLRDRTSEAHHHLDIKVSQLDFTEREGLGTFLLGNAFAHDALRPHDDAFDGHMRRRLDLLGEDMEVLHLPYAPQRLAFEPPTRETAPGFRYVIAGSAMGGRVLAQRHASSPDPDVREARQFLGDDALIQFWRDVQGELQALPQKGSAFEAVIEGAVQCFKLFERAFDAAMELQPETANA
ncbi:MAG: biliverdin-producing heme oxygenase [Pseudomonadota bacterium]